MTSSPFFCIVIPTYNRKAMLFNTLQYIFKQTFQDFEVIVVDDGSTDETGTMIREKFHQEPRLRYIFQENKERGAARNLGFKNALSEYVVFFDSDDIMHPNHLDVLHREITGRDFPDFIATQFDFVNESGIHRRSDIMNLNEGYYDYRLILRGNPLGCNFCLRRKQENLYLFPEERELSVKEDWTFLMLNLYSKRLYLVARVTISMLEHSRRSMNLEHGTRIEQSFRAADYIRSKLALPEAEDEEMMAYVNYLSSIHAYLDLRKKQAIKFLFSAVRLKGYRNKYAILLIKILVGYRFIRRLHG